MSQEKVDKYKKEKANREKLQKREKRTLFLEKLAIGAVAIVMVGWIGYSAYGVLTREDPDEEKQWLPQRWTPQQLLTTYPSFQGMLKKQNKTRRAAICSIQNCCP